MIPVLNEEKNLPKCLDALSCFPTKIVVDSGSTDLTRDICISRGVELVSFAWDGKFPKKRNWFLDNTPINTEWVFFIDADEVVTEAFTSELAEKLDRGDVEGFLIYYENYFMGRSMRFGIPQRKLAIFKKKYRFEKIELEGTSEFDMEIHEHPVGLTKVGRLTSRIEHDDFKGLSHFIHKHRIYAEWECERYFSINESNSLNFRQRIKYGLVRRWYFSWSYFFVDYILYLRILDGRSGFLYSKYKKWYFGLVRDLIVQSERL